MDRDSLPDQYGTAKSLSLVRRGEMTDRLSTIYTSIADQRPIR